MSIQPPDQLAARAHQEARQSNRRRAPVRSPAPQVCDICGGARAHRRGSCWTCYRKFLQAGLPLPLRIADRESDPLLAWAHALTKPQLRRVMNALFAASAASDRSFVTQASRARARSSSAPLRLLAERNTP